MTSSNIRNKNVDTSLKTGNDKHTGKFGNQRQLLLLGIGKLYEHKKADQHAEEPKDERVLLASLITNLKLDVDENKKIQKQLKKANTSLTQELEKNKCAHRDCKFKLERYKTFQTNKKENKEVELECKEALDLLQIINDNQEKDFKIKEDKGIDKTTALENQTDALFPKTNTRSRPLPDFDEYDVSTSTTVYDTLVNILKKHDLHPQISLNALTGITSYRRMRVIGHFGKQKIHILIDSGSTHNFLDVFMDKKLRCKIHKIDPLQVDVTEGNKIFQHEGRQVALRGTTKSHVQWFSGKQLTKHVTQRAKNLPSISLYVPATSVMSLDVIHKPVHLDHRIPLIEGSTPINIKPYKHPPSQKDDIESMVQELLDSKVIRPSNSPFSSPIVMVKRKDGTWRMYIDYRQLNKMTIKDKFLISLIKEIIDELHGSKVFSKLDLRLGYHQIRMDENDIPKIAFRNHKGHYEFLVMPFDLTNAPLTFQSLMNQVFKPFLTKFTLVFFDEILVYSAIVTDHLLHLRSILSTMGKNSLYVKKSKCVFGTAQVEYLGHVILEDGVATDPAKIILMKEWPIPTSLK
ncbi:gypsy/ty3 retroelement polyprotein [Tanacetum coccineum]